MGQDREGGEGANMVYIVIHEIPDMAVMQGHMGLRPSNNPIHYILSLALYVSLFNP